MRPLFALALMLMASLLFTTGCAKFKFWKRAESPKTLACAPEIGCVAPEIDGDDFDGKPIKLSDYRGKVVVVAFWGSSCPPCLRMIPHERELVERYRGKPFVMLGVNTDPEPDTARKIIATKGICWRNRQSRGEEDHTCKRWGVTHLPSIFVIDADGIVRGVQPSGASLDHVVEKLVADAERAK